MLLWRGGLSVPRAFPLTCCYLLASRGINVIIEVTEHAAEFAEVEDVWQPKYKKDLHY